METVFSVSGAPPGLARASATGQPGGLTGMVPASNCSIGRTPDERGTPLAARPAALAGTFAGWRCPPPDRPPPAASRRRPVSPPRASGGTAFTGSHDLVTLRRFRRA